MKETENRSIGSSATVEKNSGRKTDVNFRRQKRNRFFDTWYRFRRSLTPINLLPIAIITLGTCVAFLTRPTRFDAGTITLMTACLSGLVIYVKAVFDRKYLVRVNSIQDRFEELEDRAWELHESEERYRTVAEAFGDLLVMRDSIGAVTYCNDAFEKVFFSSKFNRSRTTSLPKFLKEQLESANGLSGKTEISVEMNGETKWFHWENVPIRDEKNGGMGILSVARDISVYKQTQQLDIAARKKAEQASKTKTKFLAMVSHEMRTPLNGVIGMSKLLQNTKLDPEQKNYAKALKSSGENLLELINSMLDLTMIEAGRFEVKRETFEFSDFMNNSIELLSSKAYAKNIDCGLFIDSKIPEFVNTDKARLRQIVLNLSGNAIKFTHKGGVMVRCLWLEDPNNKSHKLRIEVVDSGPGIKPQDRDRIFKEFERVDDDVTRNTDGAGLGLSITKALIGELGGKFELTESGKNGSMFSIELPVQVKETSKNKAKEQDFSKHNALILSSGVFEAKCLANTIKSGGGKAKIINKVETLFRLLDQRSFKYTSVFLETSFEPEISLSLGEVRRRLPEGVKVILVALPQAKQELENFKEHMDAWLIRPVRRESLSLVLTDGNKNPEIDLDEFKLDEPEKNELSGLKVNVLLAEDNDINALLVTSALKRAGAIVHRVTTGEQAVEQFRTSLDGDEVAFDTVLMDMHMPVMDGLTAITEIRKLEKTVTGKKSETPIYALTADEQNQTKRKATKAGANGFLVKPIDPNELCELVFKEVQNHHSKFRKTG